MEKKSREEIDLLELFETIWLGKKYLFSFVFIGFVAGVAYLHLTPKLYQSSIVTVMSPELGGQDRSGSALSGLASIAGVRLGGGGGSQALVLARLKSTSFLSRFIDDQDLSKIIIAGVDYDKSQGKWVYDDQLIDEGLNWIVESPSIDTKAATRFLKNWMTVMSDNDGFVTISIESIAPDLSFDIASNIVKALNASMQQEAIEDAQNRISYLKAELANTELDGMRNIFYQLIEQETQKMMLAKASNEYALKVIDPPLRPDLPFKPKGLIVLVSSLGISTIIGLLVASLIGFRILKTRP